MTLDIGPGYAAYSEDGRPVRRVITNGNQSNPPELAKDLFDVPKDFFKLSVAEVAEELDRCRALLTQLTIDAAIYGDGWVDLEGKRVDPTTVKVEKL